MVSLFDHLEWNLSNNCVVQKEVNSVLAGRGEWNLAWIS